MLLNTGEIQGAYQIKVTTTALALLLLTRHVDLGKVNVQGHLIKVWYHLFLHFACAKLVLEVDMFLVKS